MLDGYWNQIFGSDAVPPNEPAPAAAPPTRTCCHAAHRLAWQYLVGGDWAALGDRYVFDIAPLTDDRPYFAGYVRATCPASSTASNCCRTNGATCC